MIFNITFSIDSKIMAVSTKPTLGEPCLRLYETDHYTELIRLGDGSESVMSAVFTEDGSLYYLSKEVDGEYLLWFAESANFNQEKVTQFAYNSLSHDLQLNKNNEIIAVIGNSIEVIYLPSGKAIRFIEGLNKGYQIQAQFCGETNLFTFGCKTDLLVEYDVVSNKIIRELDAPGEYAKSLHISNSGKYLVATSFGSFGTFCYDLDTNSLVLEKLFNRDSFSFHSLVVNDSLLVQATDVNVLGNKIPDGKFVEGHSLNSGSVSKISISPDNRIVAIGQLNGDLSVFHQPPTL